MSMNSSAFHFGIIETVESAYGRISFEEDQPYQNAYFDLESVGNALDDLTSYFEKGQKVKSKLREANSIATDDKIKAICVMLVEKDNSLIRGGDQYLKKFLEQNGPQDINLLPSVLMEQSDNCPKFFKSNEMSNIKNVVLSRPDWFNIYDGRVLCLVLVEETVRLKLLSILKTMMKIGCDDIETIKSENKNMKDYLSPGNVKEFVSRHPSSFVYWNDYIWMTKSMLSDAEDGLQFQNDMLAVQYYSQFFAGNSKLTVNMLRGHFSQANELVKQAVKPKDSEFRSFLKRNPLFFQLDQDDNILCRQNMLRALDAYFPHQLASTNGFKENASCFNDDVLSDNKAINPAKTHKVFTDDTDICNQLQQYIKEHGALDCLELREGTDIATNNDELWPDYLKVLRDEDFERLTETFPSTFKLKCQFLCLNELENLCLQKMLFLLQTSPMTATALALKIEDDCGIKTYLSARRPIKDGIYDFVSRNSESLIFWKHEIFVRDKLFEDSTKLRLFQSEMKAIQYYAQFMKVNSPTAIVSVRGHYAQASAEIRSVVHSRSEDFTQFLVQNDFFFDVTEESVVITKNHNRCIKSISYHWIDPKPQTVISEQESSKNDQSGNDLNDVTITTIAELNGGPPAHDNEAEPLYSIQESRAFMEDNQEPPSSHISHCAGDDRTEPLDGTGLGPYEVLRTVLGEDMCCVLEYQLSQRNDRNILVLLRLHLGQPLRARFWNKDAKEYENITLGTKPIDMLDLNRLMRSENIKEIERGRHYGIKGTLHTINVMEQLNEICDVTMFFQIHEHSDGLELNIVKGGFYEFVFAGDYPDGLIYNYLRCRCAELSNGKDILVLDLKGKLSGCDASPHCSLGSVMRIQCNESNLAATIRKAIPQKHDFVFVIGVDTLDQFDALKDMFMKGIRVVAEISGIIKSKVNQLLQDCH